MQRIGGAGIPLPPAQQLYPANLTTQGTPFNPATNEVCLNAGQSIQIPAGDWIIDLGKYSILEWQDPERSGVVGGGTSISQTAGVWTPIRTQRGTFQLRSDGINFRISNLLGCPVSATVTTKGSSYVQSTTTVTPSSGLSTWQPIVGGWLGDITSTQITPGSGYGLPPVVVIAEPPAPGVPATAYATLSGTSGTVATIAFTNRGAGYTSVPVITLLPSPFDPQAATVTAATAIANTSGAGAIAAILCTNPGGPVSSLTLTIAGVGTQAVATANLLTTVTALTVSAAQQFTGTATNYTFTITGTGLTPGEHIAVEVVMLVTNASGGNTGQINSLSLLM